MKARGVRCLLLGGLAVASLTGMAGAGRRSAGLEAFAGVMLPFQDQLERGLNTGFGFTWPLAGHTRVGAHFIHAGLQSLGREHGLLAGRLTLTPFLVFLRQDLVLTSRLAFHVAAGGGIVFARLREDIITIPEVTISQHLSSSAALHLAGGFSIFILDNLAVICQGSYLHCRAAGTTTVRDMNLGVSGEEISEDLSCLQAAAGLVFYF